MRLHKKKKMILWDEFIFNRGVFSIFFFKKMQSLCILITWKFAGLFPISRLGRKLQREKNKSETWVLTDKSESF